MKPSFKTLSYQERQDLPDTAYAYTDPHGGKHLPIHDLAHLRNAIARLGQPETLKQFLSQKGKLALQAKLKRKLAQAQHSSTTQLARDIVAFDFGPDEDDSSLVNVEVDSDIVLRRGMIFRAGEYPDKSFSLTPKELKRVVKEFEGPIKIDSEHERSIFDGKLGHLVSVEASKDGSVMQGLVAIPRWLDPILMEAGGKVSAAFDRVSKKLVGLALTINPRVSDAALMAAFSVDTAVHGDASVQEVIEMADKSDKKIAKKAAKAAAESAMAESHDDDEDDNDADMSADEAVEDTEEFSAEENDDQEESDEDDSSDNFVGYDGQIPNAVGSAKLSVSNGRSMMQAIHDVTASRGAVCQIDSEKEGKYATARYASKPELDTIQSIHDTTLKSGASCVASHSTQSDVPGGTPWTWQKPGIRNEDRSDMPGTKAQTSTDQEPGSNKAMKAFAKFMESLDEVDPRYSESQVQLASRTKSDDADSRRLDEENARLREENRQMRMAGILDRAVGFADKMIHEGHATPIEREGLITVHAQLEHDDTFTAKATFSNGMSRVAAYESSILARPNNLLAAELLPASVQAGLIKFANLSETPRQNTSEYGKMTDERKRQLTGLDPVLKKAFDDTRANGHAN